MLKDVGVDTGASRTRICIGGRTEAVFETPKTYESYMSRLSHQLSTAGPIGNVVVAVPSVVEEGRVLEPPNLGGGWEGRDLAAELRTRSENISGAVKVIQDTFAAAVGLQKTGAIENLPTIILTLSTGLGGAVLWRDGIRPLEVGHAILDLSGQQSPCNCGQVGCAEADLSGTAVARDTTFWSGSLPVSYWSSYGEKLGRFISVLSPMFMARDVVLFGGVTAKSALFLPSCERVVQATVRRVPAPRVRALPESNTVGAYGSWVLASASSRQ